MAHEIGHNLGMLHDFDALHGGQNNPCNSKNNIMSYGSSMQTWSLCSKKDFQSYYTRIKSKWCMEGNNVAKVVNSDIIYSYTGWFVDHKSLNPESILVSKFYIFIYINLDKAKNYFSFI